MKYKILELTKDNERSYLEQVANLEQVVLANMEERGQKGNYSQQEQKIFLHIFIQRKNTVLVAVDEQGNVIAATYITQGAKCIYI